MNEVESREFLEQHPEFALPDDVIDSFEVDAVDDFDLKQFDGDEE